MAQDLALPCTVQGRYITRWSWQDMLSNESLINGSSSKIHTYWACIRAHKTMLGCSREHLSCSGDGSVACHRHWSRSGRILRACHLWCSSAPWSTVPEMTTEVLLLANNCFIQHWNIPLHDTHPCYILHWCLLHLHLTIELVIANKYNTKIQEITNPPLHPCKIILYLKYQILYYSYM